MVVDYGDSRVDIECLVEEFHFLTCDGKLKIISSSGHPSRMGPIGKSAKTLLRGGGFDEAFRAVAR